MATRSRKYDWAATKYDKIMNDRERAANILFDKLIELETDGYYAKLYQQKIDEELSSLIQTL